MKKIIYKISMLIILLWALAGCSNPLVKYASNKSVILLVRNDVYKTCQFIEAKVLQEKWNVMELIFTYGTNERIFCVFDKEAKLTRGDFPDLYISIWDRSDIRNISFNTMIIYSNDGKVMGEARILKETEKCYFIDNNKLSYWISKQDVVCGLEEKSCEKL